MRTIACVLRSGGEYGPDHVRALHRGVAAHLPDPRFVVLTDLSVSLAGVDVIPLVHDLPGWWSKIELFRSDVFDGPVLYLDLDTLPVGDLAAIASYDGPFAMMSHFYRPHVPQSGIMAFTPGPETAAIWEAWTRDPVGHIRRFARFDEDRNIGDGAFIGSVGVPIIHLEQHYPGQIVSYKLHARKQCPEGATLVCAHGRPKFWDPSEGWARDLWTERAEA